jgi:hypothetical protein
MRGIAADGTVDSICSRGMTTQGLDRPHVSSGRSKAEMFANIRTVGHSGSSHVDVNSCRQRRYTSVGGPLVTGTIGFSRRP